MPVKHGSTKWPVINHNFEPEAVLGEQNELIKLWRGSRFGVLAVPGFSILVFSLRRFHDTAPIPDKRIELVWWRLWWLREKFKAVAPNQKSGAQILKQTSFELTGVSLTCNHSPKVSIDVFEIAQILLRNQHYRPWNFWLKAMLGKWSEALSCFGF